MNGTYRSYNGRGRGASAGRRKSKYAPRGPMSRRSETRLIICLVIAAVFSIARLIFPSAFSAVRDGLDDYLGGSVDLKSAAYVIGEAVNGEKSVSEAFSEACGYAFGISIPDDSSSSEPEINSAEVMDSSDGEVRSA